MKLFLTLLYFATTILLQGQTITTTQNIKIDQFGYRTNAQKIAVIANPVNGYNNTSTFTPGSSYQIRSWNTNSVVYTGTLTAWNNGSVQAQSGDKVWWFDFSGVTVPGSYYVFDVSNNVASYRFEIDNCVYNPVLKQAMRMFYYQRCGFAKTAPYAGTGWVDGASHLGTQQDLDCRLYNNTNVSTSKNLSGGWFDAGDYNKYVNFTFGTLTDLLLAYEERPAAFTDDYTIPESNNGIPDILDEIKIETDWLLKMQQPNGSVLSVVGGGSASPPSTDNTPRRYGPANTSAALTTAAILALAAIQFNAVGQTTYATTLQTAAVNAYTWAVANPSVTFYNAGLLAAGEQEIGTYERDARKLAANVYLYALTGATSYRTYIDANYGNMHLMTWTFAYPFEGPEQDALLYYTKTPGATSAVRSAIINAYQSSMVTNNADNLPAYTNKTDAYRAWLQNQNYTWNSNQTKSKQANMFLAMNQYSLNPVNAANFTNAASGFVHYFHGVNPNTKVYLSNMGNYGAENSVNQFYHAWFKNNSPLWDEVGVSTYGPPPGYIPGGPNPSYALDACCPNGCGSPANNAFCTTNVSPPLGQPIQKSYKDFNNDWPINSWTITEAGIYTNAAYVRLLSKFCSTQACGNLSGLNNASAISQSLIQTIYPQPAESKVFIRVKTTEEKINIILYDPSGKCLRLQESDVSNGIAICDLNGLAKGLYLLRIEVGGRLETKKIVVE
jgi:endoglucanase